MRRHARRRRRPAQFAEVDRTRIDCDGGHDARARTNALRTRSRKQRSRDARRQPRCALPRQPKGTMAERVEPTNGADAPSKYYKICGVPVTTPTFIRDAYGFQWLHFGARSSAEIIPPRHRRDAAPDSRVDLRTGRFERGGDDHRTTEGGVYTNRHHGGGHDHFFDEHAARAHEVGCKERHRSAAANYELLYLGLDRR